MSSSSRAEERRLHRPRSSSARTPKARRGRSRLKLSRRSKPRSRGGRAPHSSEASSCPASPAWPTPPLSPTRRRRSQGTYTAERCRNVEGREATRRSGFTAPARIPPRPLLPHYPSAVVLFPPGGRDRAKSGHSHPRSSNHSNRQGSRTLCRLSRQRKWELLRLRLDLRLLLLQDLPVWPTWQPRRRRKTKVREEEAGPTMTISNWTTKATTTQKRTPRKKLRRRTLPLPRPRGPSWRRWNLRQHVRRWPLRWRRSI
mmetsp:Transcript_12451/g.36695  ORF Transcript_12451/g.36695 Transcript_12451/m.36695 type:complete len:257 (-) Transcript_12451:669-1439(-)